MNIRSGDIPQCIIDGRAFDIMSEANVNYRLSGFNTENLPTGNGKLHTKKTRKLAGVDGLPISVDPSRLDLEYLQEKWNAGLPVPVQITHPGGVTYSGTLAPEGELMANTGDGQVEISMLGEKFEQI